MLTALKRLQPDPPTPPSEAETDLARAEEKVRADESTVAALVEELDGLKIALSLAASEDQNSERTAWARGRAAKYLEQASRRPERAQSRIRDIMDTLQDIDAEHRAARDALTHARSVRTSEIAISLQPAQRTAVGKIAAALSALSAAVAEAVDLQAELARRAPLPQSLYLPDVTSELSVFASLGDWRSVGSAWCRRMTKIGVL